MLNRLDQATTPVQYNYSNVLHEIYKLGNDTTIAELQTRVCYDTVIRVVDKIEDLQAEIKNEKKMSQELESRVKHLELQLERLTWINIHVYSHLNISENSNLSAQVNELAEVLDSLTLTD